MANEYVDALKRIQFKDLNLPPNVTFTNVHKLCEIADHCRNLNADRLLPYDKLLHNHAKSSEFRFLHLRDAEWTLMVRTIITYVNNNDPKTSDTEMVSGLCHAVFHALSLPPDERIHVAR